MGRRTLQLQFVHSLFAKVFLGVPSVLANVIFLDMGSEILSQVQEAAAFPPARGTEPLIEIGAPAPLLPPLAV